MGMKLKIMGLAIVAVCAFGAVSAGAAQAAAPHWTVGTSDPLNGTRNIASTVVINEREAGQKNFELTVPGLGITLNGTGVTVNGGKIVGDGTIAGSASGSATSLSFTGVTVTEHPGCVVKNVGGTAGTVTTNAVKAALKEVGGADYAAFTPSSGSIFVEIEITKAEGNTCSVSGTYKVEGTAALQPELNALDTGLMATSNAAIQSAFNTANGTTFHFGSKPTALDITGELSLNPAEEWGVHTRTP